MYVTMQEVRRIKLYKYIHARSSYLYSFILRTSCMVTYIITLFESYIDLVTFIQLYSSNFLHAYIYIVLFFELLAWLHLYSFLLRTSCMVTYMITLFESYIDLDTFIQFYSSNFLHGYIYIVLFFQILAWLQTQLHCLKVTQIQIHLYSFFFEFLAWLHLYSLFFELLAWLHT